MNNNLEKTKTEEKKVKDPKPQEDIERQRKSLSHEEIEWVNREIRF